MNRLYWTAAVASVLVAIAPVRAQPPEPASLRGDSTQTRKRLAEADQKLIDGKTADAVDDLQRILDESAGDLISVDGKQFRTAQWFAQQILAKLPPDALKNYRDQVEAPRASSSTPPNGRATPNRSGNSSTATSSRAPPTTALSFWATSSSNAANSAARRPCGGDSCPTAALTFPIPARNSIPPQLPPGSCSPRSSPRI